MRLTKERPNSYHEGETKKRAIYIALFNNVYNLLHLKLH
jgi:hypothetical protein